MPPHLKVSKATKAAIDCTEMDSQLEALRRNYPIRISRSDRSSGRFLSMSSGGLGGWCQGTAWVVMMWWLGVTCSLLVGSRNTMLDTACEFLSPDLRPIPPQPNCAQSMQIYEEHRQVNWTLDFSEIFFWRKLSSDGGRVSQTTVRNRRAQGIQS